MERLGRSAPRRVFNTGKAENASAVGGASQAGGVSPAQGASQPSASSSSFRSLDGASAPKALGGLNVSKKAKSQKAPRGSLSGPVNASQMQGRIGNTKAKLEKAKAELSRHSEALGKIQGNGPAAQTSKAYHKVARSRAEKSIDRLQGREVNQQARLDSLQQPDGNAASLPGAKKKPLGYFSRMYPGNA